MAKNTNKTAPVNLVLTRAAKITENGKASRKPAGHTFTADPAYADFLVKYQFAKRV